MILSSSEASGAGFGLSSSPMVELERGSSPGAKEVEVVKAKLSEEPEVVSRTWITQVKTIVKKMYQNLITCCAK